MTDDRDKRAGNGDELPDDDALARLYRSMPKLEPPAEVDAAILAAARRETAMPKPSSVRALVRWGVPLAAAASIAITFALTRLSGDPRAVDVLSSRNDVAQQVTPAGSGAGEVDRHAVAESAQQAPAASPDMAPAASPDMAPAPAPAPPPAAESLTRPAAPAPQPLAKREIAPTPSDQSATRARQESASAPQHEEKRYGAAASAPRARDDFAARPKSEQDAPAAALAAKQAEVPPGRAGTGPMADSAEGRDARMAIADPDAAAWPFGLEPDLAADEACRRITAALAVACEFRGARADVVVSPPRAIDRGRHAGRSVERIAIFEQKGRIATLEIRIAGETAPLVFTRSDH